MFTAPHEEHLVGLTASSPVATASPTAETRRTLEISVSVRTILLVAGVVALGWALTSIASVLLVIFVSVFGIAVLSPVVTAMERRLHWSRRSRR